MKVRNKRFSAVIFDLDGTLIEVDDLKKCGDQILKKTLREFCVKRTSFKDRYDFWFSDRGFLLLEKWGINSEDDKRSFLDSLSRNEYDEKKRLIECGKVRLYRDADVLNKIYGKVKLGLVSNSSFRTVLLELDSFGIKKYFDSIVALGEFGNNLRPKPAPDGVVECLRELGEVPSKAIVVGDNLSDVISGEKSGAFTALIVRGGQRTSAVKGKAEPLGATFRLRTLRELEEVIQ